MKPKHLLFVLAVLFAGCSPSGENGDSISEPGDRESDPVIISKLEEIVEMRERQAKEAQLLVEMGQRADDGATEIALAEARIALAREQGQADAVVAELRNLVEILENRLARQNALFEEDRRTAADIGELRVAFLEAEVRLQREFNAQETTKPGSADQPTDAPE